MVRVQRCLWYARACECVFCIHVLSACVSLKELISELYFACSFCFCAMGEKRKCGIGCWGGGDKGCEGVCVCDKTCDVKVTEKKLLLRYGSCLQSVFISVTILSH